MAHRSNKVGKHTHMIDRKFVQNLCAWIRSNPELGYTVLAPKVYKEGITIIVKDKLGKGTLTVTVKYGEV